MWKHKNDTKTGLRGFLRGESAGERKSSLTSLGQYFSRAHGQSGRCCQLVLALSVASLPVPTHSGAFADLCSKCNIKLIDNFLLPPVIFVTPLEF